MFITGWGDAVDRQRIHRGFRASCQAAGLGDHWQPRELRHTFVSMLSAHGVDIEVISDAVGHINSGVTRSVYAHAITDQISSAAEVWDRLDARPPTLVVVLKPDHVRDVDTFVRRYDARAFGPALFWRTDIPETELEPIEPGSELPGGLVALYEGRGRNETPLWLPEQRALIFADALTAPEGELRVGATSAYEERALPALRTLLELPFEQVVVSHGEPVHDRAAYERALELPPWQG